MSSTLQACSKCWLRQRKLPVQKYRGQKQHRRVGVSLVPRPTVTLHKASRPTTSPACTFYWAGLCDCFLKIKSRCDFFWFVLKEFISLVLWYLPPCMLSLGDLISCCGSEWTDIHVIIATTLSLLIPTFTRDVPVLYLTQHIWITCTALSIKLIFFSPHIS